MLALPVEDRGAFKEPMGPVFTDADALLAAVERAYARHGGADDGEGDRDDDADNRDGDADNRDGDADNRDGDADDRDGHPLLVAVGDVVTYHLLEAGRVPDVAIVDGRTEREAVDEAIRERVLDRDADTRTVENPPAELSRDLLVALREAVTAGHPVSIRVDGEEDLATIPAVLVAPDGASIVYGQPGEGMVHVPVTPQTRTEARTLFSRLDGDVDGALAALGFEDA